jgi:hypothetical protein
MDLHVAVPQILDFLGLGAEAKKPNSKLKINKKQETS